MGNLKFDFDYWEKILTDDFIRRHEPKGNDFTSPLDLMAREKKLKAWKAANLDVAGTKADYFVFSQGFLEPRSSTRIGGVPYRPKNKPWPRDDSGEALEFIAQVNFRDSYDLVGEFPGDILLVFADDFDLMDLHFEWYHENLVDLCAESDIPPIREDWPIDPDWMKSAADWKAVKEPLTAHIFRTEEFPGSDLNYAACKIGGCFDDALLNKFKGCKPIFELQSILCNAHMPYPWVNRQQYTAKEQNESRSPLSIGDMGCLTFFLTRKATIKVHCFSY